MNVYYRVLFVIDCCAMSNSLSACFPVDILGYLCFVYQFTGAAICKLSAGRMAKSSRLSSWLNTHK